MRSLLLIALIFCPSSLYAASKGALENPQPNDYASGIYLISGWVCDAERVEVLLDGSEYLQAAYGSERMDTVSACGDADNGFGLLVNMANLSPGEHQLALISDGQVIDSRNFTVAATSSGEFAVGLDGCAVSEGFPSTSKETLLKWTESLQGFQRVQEKILWPYQIEGIWLAEGVQAAIWVYRQDCEQLKIFLYADLTDGSGGKDLLRLEGVIGANPFELSSTEDDGAERTAIMDIKSNDEAVLKFTECGPALAISCDWTPVNGQIFLLRGPNPMDQLSIYNQ